MKKIIVLSIFCLCSNILLAQTKSDETVAPTTENQAAKSEPEIYKVVEQMPEYPGGITALHKFIIETVKYPDTATENEIEGLVKVKFVVDEQGEIRDVKASNKPYFGYGLEEEAVRVVKMLPRWKPGKNNGKPVKVYFQIPIRFALPKEEEKVAAPTTPIK